MIEALPWLRRIPAFTHADPRALARAAAHCEVRHYARRRQVVRSGSAQTHVLIIAQGALHLYRQNREAKTQILVAVVQAPATFGDAELYADSPWMVSARSVADTVIVHMPNAAYDALVEADGTVAAALYREACARLLLAVQVMQVHGLQKVQNKILRLLWEKASAPASHGGARVARISQVELAEALGVNRKTIARNLRELETQGLIRRSSHAVELLISQEDLPWKTLAGGGASADWKLPSEPG
ncbi:MAG: cyclic nucleotide-binding domain-containing protein [Deltaproteobacteria bacterium]|nr:cyclic nucleotide-binding domain-containing protein [Deltaproteobacteria bacterium]